MAGGGRREVPEVRVQFSSGFRVGVRGGCRGGVSGDLRQYHTVYTMGLCILYIFKRRSARVYKWFMYILKRRRRENF